MDSPCWWSLPHTRTSTCYLPAWSRCPGSSGGAGRGRSWWGWSDCGQQWSLGRVWDWAALSVRRWGCCRRGTGRPPPGSSARECRGRSRRRWWCCCGRGRGPRCVPARRGRLTSPGRNSWQWPCRLAGLLYRADSAGAQRSGRTDSRRGRGRAAPPGGSSSPPRPGGERSGESWGPGRSAGGSLAGPALGGPGPGSSCRARPGRRGTARGSQWGPAQPGRGGGSPAPGGTLSAGGCGTGPAPATEGNWRNWDWSVWQL